MSYLRAWYAALAGSPYRGLLHYCDTKLSQLTTDAAGRLVRFSDISQLDNHLLTVGGNNGPLVVQDGSGGVTLSFPSDCLGLTNTLKDTQQPISCTLALLYRIPNYPGDYGSPWYFSPTKQREPRPFFYLSGWSSLLFDGGGYFNFGAVQQQWQLLIVSRNAETANDRWYHTNNGLNPTSSNTYLKQTGSLLGADFPGNYELKSCLLANYPYSDDEMRRLIIELSTRHNLSL